MDTFEKKKIDVFRILYNTAYILLLVPATVVFLLIKPKRFIKEFSASFFQRIGFYPAIVSSKERIILRASSLGEVRVAEKILPDLDQYCRLLCVGTVSAYNYAKERQLAEFVVFTPPDFILFVRNFFKKMGAKRVVLIESELWPEFVKTASAMGINVIVVNGRFSPRTLAIGKFLKSYIKTFINSVNYFCVRYASDKNALGIVGVPGEKIEILGNLKYVFDADINIVDRSDYGFSKESIIVTAGSTHCEDEKELFKAFRILSQKYDNLILIIVPRYIERVDEVIKIFQNAATILGSSQLYGYACPSGKLHSDRYRCFVSKKVGELEKLYSISDISFVGGSFGSRGGQNPIEPAYYYNPVIFGQNMDNFENEAEKLIDAGAAYRVNSSEELTEKLEFLIKDGHERKKMAERAHEIVMANSKAKAATLKAIREKL